MCECMCCARTDEHVGVEFQTPLRKACCASPGCCCASCFCLPCASCKLRQRALDYDMTKYSCCQGYYGCCCCRGGKCGEQNCPSCCLCLEVFCCTGISISASRQWIMETYHLRVDPCDNCLVCFSNCLQCAACILGIVAAFVGGGTESAYEIVRLVSCLVFLSVSACMVTQSWYEMDYQDELKKQIQMQPAAPGVVVMSSDHHQQRPGVVIIQEAQPVPQGVAIIQKPGY